MKIKIKVIPLILIFCILAGCKVETPSQHAASAAVSSAVSSAVSLSASSDEERPSSSGASSADSGSKSESSSAVSSGKSLSTAAKAVPASSAPTQAPAKAPAKPVVKQAVSSPAAPKAQTCTIEISCSDILANRDRFGTDKLASVPADGTVLGQTKTEFKNGETVFDVLLRETGANGIKIEHSAGIFQSEYVKGIAGIYEKQWGPSSGWTYTVNGKQPPVACNSYKLNGGECIRWIFICGQQ